MGFNEEELKKIENATAGWFKKSARTAISKAISALRLKIERAKMLPQPQQQAAFKELVDNATESRHRAIQSGANSYNHSDWAAAAACESWLHEIVGGTEDGLMRIEGLINKLERRGR